MSSRSKLGRKHVPLALFLLVMACKLQLRAQSPLLPSQSQVLPGENTGQAATASGATVRPLGPGTSDAVDSDNLLQDDQDAVAFGAENRTATLSTAEILLLLQQTPELVVELKSTLADHLSQQGAAIDSNSITDEQLYAQLAARAELRAAVTAYLRARGYVSPADLKPDAGTAGSTLRRSPSSSGEPGVAWPSIDANSEVPSAYSLYDFGDSRRPTAPVRAGANSRVAATAANSSTDPPSVLRRPAPYNLQSLRDLYTQLPQDETKLRRFGSELFTHAGEVRSAITSSTAVTTDVPLGPDYVVGAGDTLAINLWGGTAQALTRTVGADGILMLPEAGALQVAGLTLERLQAALQTALARQFRDVHVSVTIARLRSVRVYVVGDVQRPGAYDLSSLSTPISALYAAGGPTAAGSLRMLRHLRGSALVEQIDLYSFLLQGIRPHGGQFQSGDTLEIPPAGPLVSIAGAIRRPAIYEITSADGNLQALLEAAGGTIAAAALGHITVERIEPNSGRRTITVPAAPQAEPLRDTLVHFMLQDGDRIRIGSVAPFSERVVYLAGHVIRPGRVAYRDGLSLRDVLGSTRDLLPEPAARGEIIRLVPPDLHVSTQFFDLPDVLIGNQNVLLTPFDTVRILGRYEQDAPTVTITGEVQRPGDYPMSEGMTAAALVRMAGGFKRAALRETADLTSHSVLKGERVESSLSTIRIGAAVDGQDASADRELMPGDVLTVRQITGWNDIGQSVTVEGQARYPGTYGFREGERLSAVLRRAGGLRETAYPEGAVLIRAQVRELEEKSRDELVRQIQATAATARLSPRLAAAGDIGSSVQLIKAQQDQVLADLKAHPPVGRMVIHISADLDGWANTTDDIELRRGDVLTIPTRPGFVLVTGQVYNGTALTFSPGKTAEWYLSRAGGANRSADRKDLFVIRANGTVVGRRSHAGWFASDVLNTKLYPGDVVVVPQKLVGSSLLWRNLLSTAQLASSIAITSAVSGL